MKKLLMLAAIAVFQFSTAQITRDVGEFSSLKVYDKITVTLHHSGENKVESNNSDVEIVNKNGDLKIRMIPTKVMQGDQVQVKIYYDQLCDIQASQGSSISSDSDFDCTAISLVSNEGSRINLMLNTQKLDAKLNSGGMIEVSGISTEQDIIVNSGGKFSGKDLDSEKVKVASNAGGNASVNVSESVTATTRAGGVIDVYGDPGERNIKNIIGGKVNFK